MAALLRRGVQPPALAACKRGAGLLWPCNIVRNALAAPPCGAESGREQQGAPTAAAAATAAQLLPRLYGCLAAERAPALEAREQMQAALARGEYAEVLQLLRQAEAAAAAAAAAPASSSAPPPSAAWHPNDRAALYDTALQACAQFADADTARRLVGSMWKGGVPVGIVANTALLRALCAAGRHAAALNHLRSVPAKRQRTLMFTVLLRSCNEAGALEVGQAVLALFHRRQHPQDAQFAAEAIRLHGALGDVAAAEAAWQQASADARSEGDAARLHAARVAALAQACQLQAAVGAFEEMLGAFASLLPVDASRSLAEAAAAEAEAAAGASLDPAAAAARQQQRQAAAAARASPVHFMQQARNAVLRAAQAAGDTAAAKKVASLATLRGLPPDVGTYNCLLRAALAHGDGLQAVLEGVQELRRLGLKPDRETYSLVLQACAAEGDAAAAQAALDAMPGDGVPQSRPHFRRLLAACSAAGDLEGVDGAYRRLRAAGFAPDAATFRLLFDAVAHWAELDAASRAGSAEPALVAATERIHQRQLAAALLARWVGELQARPPATLSPSLFASLLNAYSHSGQVQQVLLLMRQAYGCQLSPGTAQQLGVPASLGGGSGSSSSSVLGALDAAMLEDSSRQAAVGAAGAADLPPGSSGTPAEASSSGSSSGGGSATRAAAPLRQEWLEEAQLAPALSVYNAAIGACTRVGHRHMGDAVALLRSMQAQGLSPDVHTFTSLIAGCAYGRQAALARELLRQMQRRGLQPSPWTHNALLKVECWTYGVDAGHALVRQMAQQGIEPDRATWSTLLASAKFHRRGDIAELAQAQLDGQQQRGAEDEAEAARQQEAGATAGQPGVAPAPEDDHRWHGYYEQQEEEDEW